MSKDVVSLTIAKKLKEAGWKQAEARQLDGGYIFHSSFYYAPYSGDAEIWPLFYHGEWREALKDNDIKNFIAAPTIGELAHALPMDIHIDKLTRDGKECYRVTLTQDEKMDYDTIEDTLADTLGMCLVRLMKDGYKPYGNV